MPNVRNYIGFETGDLAESDFQSVGAAVVCAAQTDIKRSGNYGLLVHRNTNAANCYVRLSGIGASGGQQFFNGGTGDASCYVSFWIWIETRPASTYESIFTVGDVSGNSKAHVCLKTDGSLEIRDSAVALVGSTGTTVLEIGRWHNLRFRVDTGAVATCELYVNGALECSGTGNTNANNCGHVRIGSTNLQGRALKVYYDDVAVASDGFPADSRITFLPVNADGDSAQWMQDGGIIPSEVWESVADTPNDGDSTYIKSTVANQSHLFGVANAMPHSRVSSNSIQAVKVVAIARRVDATTGSLIVLMKSNTTTAASTGSTCTQAYVAKEYLAQTDPHDSAAWTMARLNSVQAGVRQNSNTFEMRCTMLGASVLWTPATRSVGMGGQSGMAVSPR